MVVADAQNTIGAIASVVAAGAALVTVVYARATIGEARAARQEAEEAHLEELAQQSQLLQATKDTHAEELHKQAELLQATMAAHQQEMEERGRALATELVLQRLVQLGRITDVLQELADIARTEMVDRPPPLEGTPFLLTRTTGMLARLEASVVIFESLGGPSLSSAEKLTKEGRRANTPPGKILGDSMGVLDEITFLARDDERLCLPKGGPSGGLWAR